MKFANNISDVLPAKAGIQTGGSSGAIQPAALLVLDSGLHRNDEFSYTFRHTGANRPGRA